MTAELSGTEPRSGQVRLTFTGTGLEALVWGLFALILGILIILAGWGIAAISRWLVHSVTLDDGATVEFHGRGSQIWGYYILMFFIQAVSNFIPGLGGVIAWLVNSRIQLAIWQWFFREVHMSDRGTLVFTGQYWPYVGWSFILLISIFSIVGWAWVMAAYLRWVYRNIDIGGDQVVFWGTGLEILWRGIVTVLVSILIITIPWMAVWYIQWFVSQTTIERTRAQ